MSEIYTQKRVLQLYQPHEMQLRMHNSKARFKVGAWGRQSGKSTYGVNELAYKGWIKPAQTLWFVSPTFDQAKNQYRRLVGMLWNCNDMLLKKNQSELRLKFINGTNIHFKSGESLDNLRGSTLDGVIIDEVRDQHADLWPMVIRPMLATTGGWGTFISTPNGFDQFYDLFSHGQASTALGWECFQAPSTCNPLITEEELIDARRTMSEAEFAQEYLAEFRDLTAGRAYANFSQDNIKEVNPFAPNLGEIHPMLPIIVGMDFNITPMAWALGQKKIDDYYWFDEIWLKQSHTPEAAEVLAHKIMALEIDGKPFDYKKIGIILCGDATSKSSQRAAAGQSDYDILCQTLDRYGIKWINQTPESNPQVKDRVNNVNAKLKDANGIIHCWFHPRMKETIKDMQRTVWKIGTGGAVLDQSTDKERTHASDAIGYPMCELSPLVYKKGSTKMSVIHAPSI